MTHLRASDALITSNATKATIDACIADEMELERTKSTAEMVYGARPARFTEYFLRKILATVSSVTKTSTATSVTIRPHQDYYPISGNELPYDEKWINTIIVLLRLELRILGYSTRRNPFVFKEDFYTNADSRKSGQLEYYTDYLVVDWSNASKERSNTMPDETTCTPTGDPIWIQRLSESSNETSEYDYEANGWHANWGHIRKTFVFKNFNDAMEWMDCMIDVIDTENHHPVWTNDYNKVYVHLTTHDAVCTVTNKDLRMAREMDAMLTMFE